MDYLNVTSTVVVNGDCVSSRTRIGSIQGVTGLKVTGLVITGGVATGTVVESDPTKHDESEMRRQLGSRRKRGSY